MWKENLSCLIKDYDSKIILNIEETFVFFYKAQRSQSLHSKEQKCTGGKHSKLRVTVLVGVNKEESKN